jgi:hypothetical protein
VRELLRVVAVAVVILGAVAARAADETTYKGKPAAEWAPLLKDADDETRLTAITALVEIGKGTDRNALAAKVDPLLEDTNLQVRAKAALWANQFNKPKKAIKAAADVLASRKAPAWACVDAARALEAAGAASKPVRAVIVEELKSIQSLGFNLTDEKDPRAQEAAAIEATLKAIDAAPAKP